ncbi:hypothetical protein CWM42_25910, partial [Escherichia coli]
VGLLDDHPLTGGHGHRRNLGVQALPVAPVGAALADHDGLVVANGLGLARGSGEQNAGQKKRQHAGTEGHEGPL